MSRRALGSEHASQFSTLNQSIVAELGRTPCLQVTKRLICRKFCLKRLTKFEVKKGLVGPQDSCQGQLVLFIVHMHDEFHVPGVLIVLLYKLSRVLSQTKAIL